MNNKKRFTTQGIVAIGLMAALVFIFTNFRWKFPTPLGQGMIHMGNVMCLLAGMLFGGVPGGLAAGLGSALFDLTSEYAAEFWITGINKFFMGFVCGVIAVRAGKKDKPLGRVLGGIMGIVAYIILWQGKNIVYDYFIMQVEWPVVWADVVAKAVPSLFNGVFAIVASVLLAQGLTKPLDRIGFLQKARGTFGRKAPAPAAAAPVAPAPVEAPVQNPVPAPKASVEEMAPAPDASEAPAEPAGEAPAQKE